MIYTIEQIKELVEPIAQKYELKTLWVFGSYARGEATEESDVDLLMDYTGSIAKTCSGFMSLTDELEQTFNKKVDLLSTDNLFCYTTKRFFSRFMNIVANERVILYEKT
jgi:predicted nucleotidyltransferase